MANRTARQQHPLATLHHATGEVRGTYPLKQAAGRKYMLIGRRWCRVVQRPTTGTLVEVWREGDSLVDALGRGYLGGDAE